jgi:hypothetical protein
MPERRKRNHEQKAGDHSDDKKAVPQKAPQKNNDKDVNKDKDAKKNKDKKQMTSIQKIINQNSE